MADKKKVQKSEQTLLNEKFAKGEITAGYFARRTRELAKEKSLVENESLKEEIAKLTATVEELTTKSKKQTDTYNKRIEQLEKQLNSKDTETEEQLGSKDVETEEQVQKKYTSYEDLKKYLDKHILITEVFSTETAKRIMTNIVIMEDISKVNTYYRDITQAMTGMCYGSQLVLDDNGKLEKKYYSKILLTGEEKELVIENLADRLYSCEICRPAFGKLPTFVTVGDRRDCSLFAEGFDWYFEEQDKYLEEDYEEFSFDNDFEDDDEESCDCDNKEDNELDTFEDVLGALLLAHLFF